MVGMHTGAKVGVFVVDSPVDSYAPDAFKAASEAGFAHIGVDSVVLHCCEAEHRSFFSISCFDFVQK